MNGCDKLPIIRLRPDRGTFVMSCWFCDWKIDLTDKLTAMETKILIAKHNIRQR